MMPQPTPEDLAPRPSRVIAEALVERYGQRQIAARAASLGLPRQLTQVIVAACASVAAEGAPSRRRHAVATS
jgi:hypothetical protein